MPEMPGLAPFYRLDASAAIVAGSRRRSAPAVRGSCRWGDGRHPHALRLGTVQNRLSVNAVLRAKSRILKRLGDEAGTGSIFSPRFAAGSSPIGTSSVNERT